MRSHGTESSAVDPEGTEISWQIGDTDEEFFRISEDGVLSFITPPDYENPVDFRLNNTYEIRILAVDSGIPSQSGGLNVQIEIKRVNELGPVTGETQISVEENHTGTLGQYQVEDPEDDAVAWSLSGSDAALFQIDEAGNLSLSTALDFEALGSDAGTNDYSVTIVATDDGRDPVSRQLQVTVTPTDVNEAPISIPVPVVELPVGSPATTLNLNQFFIDPDGDTLTFTLGGPENPNVASAVLQEGDLSITPVAVGTTSFPATATDPAGLSAAGAIEVSVASRPPEPMPRATPMPTPAPTEQPTTTSTGTRGTGPVSISPRVPPVTPTPKPTPTPTPTPTATPTPMPTPTPTATPMPIPIPSSSAQPTARPTPSPTPIAAPIATPGPTSTADSMAAATPQTPAAPTQPPTPAPTAAETPEAGKGLSPWLLIVPFIVIVGLLVPLYVYIRRRYWRNRGN